jgi:energy-coupling factor transporter ATP-binding protein EcfA2
MNQIKAHVNPFPGIRSFETEESHLFFGRESQIENIISVLTQTHFLAIVGSSGSGKSSLIRAGVIPAILKGQINNRKNWDITVFKPGDNPISSFAIEYAQTFNKKATAKGTDLITSKQVEKNLRSDRQPILNAHLELGSNPWFIVIDQFEEIFRYQKQANSAAAKHESVLFINLFLDLINNQESDIPIYVVLTMRSDFLDQCTEIPGLTEAMNKGHFLIPRMSPQSLHDAIVKPVKESGDNISGELVDRLISDLGDQSDQLPVMQHALMRAWDYWIENRVGNQPLDLQHYEAVGTIASALSQHAEEIFNDLKKDELKTETERLFKALTDFGSDKKSTRRPSAFADILKITNSSENDLIEIIDQFRAPGRAFLMPPHYVPIQPETVIDISHESLMRVWGRLKEWVDEETKSAELYLRLSKSAELYQQGKSGLWTNPELEIAVKWKQKNKPNPYWAERYDPAFERAIEFLDYSKKESDFEIKKKENRQKRELSRARKIVIFLSVASIISILFLIISLNLKFKAEASEEIVVKKGVELQEESKKSEIQRKEAVAQKRIAEQQQIIAEQQKLITEEQRQYAIAQQDSARRSEIAARAAKVLADSSAQRAKRSEIVAKAAKVLADSSAQKAKISAEEAIKSEKNTKRLRLLAIARSMAIQSQRVANINPELSALLAGQAYNFNLENGGRKDDPDIFNALSNIADDKLVFLGHKDVVRGVDLSKDGNWIYSCSDDGRLLVWSSKDPREKPLSLNTNGLAKKGIRCVAVQDNKVLAGTSDGVILYWDKAEKGAPPQSIPTRNSIINKVNFISNNRIASIGADGFIEIWNLNDLTSLLFFEQMSAAIKDLAISGDGTKLACVDQNGVVKIYRVSQITDQPITLKTNKSLKSIALNSDGSLLLTGDDAGMIHLWDMSNPDKTPLEFSDHRSAITALRFSPNDKTFASSSYDNTIRIWNPEDPKQNPIVIADNDSWVMDIAFSPNGNQLISAGNDQTIRLFEINTDILSSKICDKVKRNLTASEWVTFVGKDIKYQKTCPQIITDK